MGTCNLADGTQFGDILHLFEDVKEGLKIITKVGIVKAADDELLSGHQDHLLVEFANWINDAQEKKRQGSLKL